jgi:hypothetical protein
MAPATPSEMVLSLCVVVGFILTTTQYIKAV